MTLEEYSLTELEIEVDRRKKENAAKLKPRQILAPNFVQLRKICQEYIDAVEKEEYIDEDLRHYIFETAITTIFGKDVFSWINNKNK